jgi:hypothetical protein
MTLHKISLDDWEGYYHNGILLIDGHRVPTDKLLELLNIKVISHYIPDNDLDEFGNRLPEKLADMNKYLDK